MSSELQATGLLGHIPMVFVSTIVSRIYAPPFATLALVENVGGAYMRGLTFYLANTPPLPVPRLDVDLTLYILQKLPICPRY